jgi:hypothetical protein
MMAGLPVIMLFATILAVVLTGIFVLEAFVTQLYNGPGHRFVVSLLILLFTTFLNIVLQGFRPNDTFLTPCSSVTRNVSETCRKFHRLGKSRASIELQ